MLVRLLILVSIFICYAASDNFPTTEEEWWTESYINSDTETGQKRCLRIKAECINMRIQQILKKAKLQGLPNYNDRFYSTGRDFWTEKWSGGSHTFKDTDKMLSLIYDQLVYIDSNLGGSGPVQNTVPSQPWRKW